MTTCIKAACRTILLVQQDFVGVRCWKNGPGMYCCQVYLYSLTKHEPANQMYNINGYPLYCWVEHNKGFPVSTRTGLQLFLAFITKANLLATGISKVCAHTRNFATFKTYNS